MSLGQKHIIDHVEWSRRLVEAEVSKTDMDRLVMQYLVTEGYKEAAEQFALDTNIQPEVELTTIGERMAIRNAVQEGDIPAAIEKVNDLNPELLDTHPRLYFQLRLQHLIELIRARKVPEALELVQEELASLCEDSEELLSELESALALLAFDPPADPSDAAAKPPPAGALETPESIRGLWSAEQRHRTASRLNAAILAAQGLDKEPKLLFLLKMLVWAQEQLSEHASFPRIHDLVAAVPAHSGCA